MAPIRTISKEELRRKLERHDRVQIVNVLDPSSYHLGSIPGSKRIPLAELPHRLDELEPATDVITYCAGAQCPASRDAAEFLAEQGVSVRAYEGGITEWKDAGYPIEELVPASAG
jgi:ArsR family transcriptional regulator